MLREVTVVRQDSPDLRLRWFQDDYFDLFVWSEPGRSIAAFQLSYDRSGRERALAWHRDKGHVHRLVDSGEQWPLSNATPLLVGDAGRFPRPRVLAEFAARSRALEAQLRLFVRERVVKYRRRSGRRGLSAPPNP